MVKKTVRPREVTNVINSREVTNMMLVNDELPVEVRQKRDGTYTIWYPEEGWLPCPPNCESRHKHEYNRPHTESYYQPKDLDDALAYAQQLAGEREVKVVGWVSPAQRLKQSKEKSSNAS